MYICHVTGFLGSSQREDDLSKHLDRVLRLSRALCGPEPKPDRARIEAEGLWRDTTIPHGELGQGTAEPDLTARAEEAGRGRGPDAGRDAVRRPGRARG